MKIDLFINLLDGKKRLGKSAHLDLSSAEDSHSQANLERSDADKNYRIDLSTRSLNSRGRLAYSVRDQNVDSLTKLSTQVGVPQSVSQGLKRPKEKDLGSLINSLTAEPSKLVKAHGKLSRTRSEDLLLKKN